MAAGVGERELLAAVHTNPIVASELRSLSRLTPESATDVRRCGPFLKWAGGKRWLVQRYPKLFPKGFKNYLEPFLGSAAAFFSLCPNHAVLGDANCNLIAVYNAVKTDPLRIHNLLKTHHDKHSTTHYYEVRGRRSTDAAQRAADFIYLNRTCWNGLYRVNLRGEFNVPIGTKQRVILPTDDFLAIAHALGGAELLNSDFEDVVDRAGTGDFVFVDPPYTVRHDNNGFVKYNENIFRWADQCRLRDALVRASERGASVLVTNANHKSIRELYCEFGSMLEVHRPSIISGLPSGRTVATELVIRNFA